MSDKSFSEQAAFLAGVLIGKLWRWGDQKVAEYLLRSERANLRPDWEKEFIQRMKGATK